MHELGLAQQTLEMALRIARQQQANRIVAFQLKIGDWSGVVVEALAFALTTISKDTIAEGADIRWQTIPPAVRCSTCSQEYGVANYNYVCPVCGTENVDLCRGQEMELLTIEVDECATIADVNS
jgi:hydrogenase nickel incorporation protein HypA/HybF